MEIVDPNNVARVDQRKSEIKEMKFHETDEADLQDFQERGWFGRWVSDTPSRTVSPVNQARIKREFQM